MPEQFQKQLEVGLPLSKKQMNKIEQLFKHELIQIRREKEFERLFQRRRNHSYNALSSTQPGSTTRRESITYEQLIQNHIEQLKQIRVHESQIKNPDIKFKWENIQIIVRRSKSVEDIDYSRGSVKYFV